MNTLRLVCSSLVWLLRHSYTQLCRIYLLLANSILYKPAAQSDTALLSCLLVGGDCRLGSVWFCYDLRIVLKYLQTIQEELAFSLHAQIVDYI